MRAFENANDRAATPAERKLLRDLAARFQPAAESGHRERAAIPGSGWSWLEAAVWEAVESHRTHLEATGALGAKRRARLLREVEALAAERFRLRMTSALEDDADLVNDLVERRVDPYRAAAMLVAKAAG